MVKPVDGQKTILIELLTATGSGDKKAFSRLYRLTSSKLYAVALRILKQESTAQDCLQESFISIWRQADSYQSHRAAPMTWLTTIVRNRSIDILRKQPRDEVSDEAEWELTSAFGKQDDHIDHLAIEKCLAELKSEQRDCILHAYYEGLTHPELADYMQIPLGTIKTWIRRGLEQIRQCLQR